MYCASGSLRVHLTALTSFRRTPRSAYAMPQAVTDSYHSRWEGFWQNGVAPGQMWDMSLSAPSLVKLLDEEVSASGKTVRGYDLVEFARRGATKVVGLEISPTAITEARKYVSEHASKEGLDVIPEVMEGDWLSNESCSQKFDIGYDYTFFCALHPDMRKAWADGWARRLNAGGQLITLMFPVEAPGREGPPWPLSPQDYHDVLEPLGFTCTKQDKVPEQYAGRQDRIDKEVLAVWTRK